MVGVPTSTQGILGDDAPSDAELIAKSLDDAGVFGVIFERHATTIHRYLVRRVGSWDADPLTGDVFEIAFARRATFDQSNPNARPWLYGIATNLIARAHRSEARQLHAIARLSSQPPADVDPARTVVERDDLATQHTAAAAAITDLPPGERDVLLLFAWEELNYHDIAAALGVPIGTVRSRLNRARTRLRTPIDTPRDTACEVGLASSARWATA
mgnify:CR=1 FL=1